MPSRSKLGVKKVIRGGQSAGRDALKLYDNVGNAVWAVTGGIPRRIAGVVVGEKNSGKAKLKRSRGTDSGGDMPDWVTNPASGKFQAVADKYMQKVFDKYGKSNVTVKRSGGSGYLGYVKTFDDGSIEIAVPTPTTPEKLNTFVHECCHALMDHAHEAQSKAEYEAAKCARETLDREGMPHAGDEEEDDISNVIGGMITDIRDGNHLDSRAVSMVRDYLKREDMTPDNDFAKALNQYERKTGHALL